MAGTIPLSLTQQFDIYGKPLSGGQLFIIRAGTVSTPQDAFIDTALTIKQPYPMPLDAAGRIPQFFLADGSVKVRLQDRAGVVQLAADSVLVIGPSTGGGGGSPVDPTQLIQTGNMILRYGFGPLAGYVRGNNLTIGSATSGATERANADTQALFQYLWGVDPDLAVSGGRGASAAADWTANKQLSLPDWRGYAVTGADGMGAPAAGRMPGFTNADRLGGAGGAAQSALAVTNLPPHTHSGNTITESGFHTHTVHAPVSKSTGAVVNPGASNFFWTGIGGDELSGVENPLHTHLFTTNVGDGGPSSTPFNTYGPRKICTVYIKL